MCGIHAPLVFLNQHLLFDNEKFSVNDYIWCTYVFEVFFSFIVFPVFLETVYAITHLARFHES